MFNRHSLKLGLTGAVLIIMGSFTACSDEGPTAPVVAAPQYDTGCIVVGGMLVCQ
jgi:hypothetical protein